jgi:hypothetical protein
MIILKELPGLIFLISSARLDDCCGQFIKFINLFSNFQGVLPLSSYLGGIKPAFFLAINKKRQIKLP